MSENMFRSQKNSDERIAQIQKHLAECTPERLQDELDDLILSTDGSEADIALIDAYLAELDKRVPLEPEITVEESLENFHAKHGRLETMQETVQEPARKRRRPAKYFLLIAAVICLVGLLAMQATGAELFGSLARWSDETFGISFGYETEAMDRDPEYAQLQQALEDAGVTVPLVPRYLPEGYVQTEFSALENNEVLFAWYACNDAGFGIQIKNNEVNPENDTQKTDESPESIIIDGVEHYILVNNGTYKVSWVNEGYTCVLYGVTEKSELYTIIESIYMEDLS
ncbi:MAG: DUF4367 domain-containing protein [Lachnospiraceae bacterium]|nr:DUF4367 domain-containing protein [Lachnospiraceae bacterium]